MTPITRRRLLGAAAAMTAGATGTESLASGRQVEDFSAADPDGMRLVAEAFMLRNEVPGMSVAITKDGRLVYTRGFGLADKESGRRATPGDLFRIASVTKPITSVTIFRLVEAGRISLSNKVFGPGGIFGDDFRWPASSPYVGDITVEHLLTHTGGGWQNDGRDPMFTQPQVGHHDLIQWTLAHAPLQYPPGTHYAYSNFGYCILGRVIEKLTGRPYADAVRELVFKPCGIRNMHIAGDTLAERRPDEVVYYNQANWSPYSVKVARMDSHGGWLATPTDLMRFAVRVDGFPTKADILRPDTIRTMTTPTAASGGYAKGWQVNKQNNWWHGGSLPGTVSILVRTSGGFCWAALCNGGRPGTSINLELDQMVWRMVGKVHAWPSYDLFDGRTTGRLGAGT